MKTVVMATSRVAIVTQTSELKPAASGVHYIYWCYFSSACVSARNVSHHGNSLLPWHLLTMTVDYPFHVAFYVNCTRIAWRPMVLRSEIAEALDTELTLEYSTSLWFATWRLHTFFTVSASRSIGVLGMGIFYLTSNLYSYLSLNLPTFLIV